MNSNTYVSYTITLDVDPTQPFRLDDLDHPWAKTNAADVVFLGVVQIRSPGTIYGTYFPAKSDGTPAKSKRRIGYLTGERAEALLAKIGYAPGLLKALDAALETAGEAAAGYIDFALRDFAR